MTQLETDYGFRTKIDLPYEQTIEKVTVALKAEGTVADEAWVRLQRALTVGAS